jgi:hypothetical protein
MFSKSGVLLNARIVGGMLDHLSRRKIGFFGKNLVGKGLQAPLTKKARDFHASWPRFTQAVECRALKTRNKSFAPRISFRDGA